MDITVSVVVGTVVVVVVVVDVVGDVTTVVQLGSVADPATVSVTHFVIHVSSSLAQELEVLVRVCSVVVGVTHTVEETSTTTVVDVVVVQRLSRPAVDSRRSLGSSV